jgi:hypothetical protein
MTSQKVYIRSNVKLRKGLSSKKKAGAGVLRERGSARAVFFLLEFQVELMDGSLQDLWFCTVINHSVAILDA